MSDDAPTTAATPAGTATAEATTRLDALPPHDASASGDATTSHDAKTPRDARTWPAATTPAEAAGATVAMLRAEPAAFEFVQAARLLRAAQRLARAADHTARLDDAGGADDAAPAARFIANPSLAYAAAEIDAGPVDADDGLPVPTLATNFIGLHGPSGLLPPDVTVAARTLGRDSSLTQVLDFFNDRLARAFYRAAEAALPAAQLEAARLGGPADALGAAALALGGGFDRRDARRGPRQERALLRYYAGLLRRRPVSAAALRAILRAELGLPVAVEPMTLMAAAVERGSQLRVGGRDGDGGARVGGAILGRSTRQLRWTVLVRIGPLDFKTYRRLLPGRRAIRRIAQLVRHAIGANADYTIQLVLAADQAPAWSLPSRRAAGAPQQTRRLGRDLWLGAPPSTPTPTTTAVPWRLRRDFAECRLTAARLRSATPAWRRLRRHPEGQPPL